MAPVKQLRVLLLLQRTRFSSQHPNCDSQSPVTSVRIQHPLLASVGTNHTFSYTFTFTDIK